MNDDKSKKSPEKQPAKKKSEDWSVDKEVLPVDDSLLQCLVAITKIEHRPFSPEALVAGLPLVNNKLTPELFIRAAQRADLSANIVSRPLSEISNLVLPVVLLLKDKKACVLNKVKRTKQGTIAQIIQPEAGEGAKSISLESLETSYTGYAIFIKPSFKFETRTEVSLFKTGKHWFKDVLNKILPFYVEITVASLMINVFALAAPLYTMNVYDRVVPNNAMETLIVLSLGIFIVYSFDFLMKMLRGYFIDIVGKKTDVLLSARIYEQMMGVKMSARPESVGSFANNMSQFDSFREMMTSATIATIIDLPFLFIFIAVMWWIGGSVALVPLIAAPIILMASFIIQFPLNNKIKESYRYSGQKQATLIETLITAEHIKASNAEGVMQSKWEKVVGLAAKIGNKVKILSNLATFLTAYIQQIASIGIVVLGVLNIIEGEMTMGALIACNMLNSRALSPLGQVASLITKFSQSMTSYKSVDDLMKMPTDRPLGKTPLQRDLLKGNIEFKNVTLTYPNDEVPALNDVTFSIKAGEKVAILGRIGSGKSTVEKLLMGLYSPDKGNIYLDGTEMQQLDISCVRRSIGYVPQDLNLIFGTVKENITMAAPYASDKAVLKAATIAGVSDFALRHPKGFDLPVGERGGKLSGGQRQSIAIARSLLLNPNILVLDEPTNMMDDKSEQLFMARLKANLNNKTLLLVTHKGSMLQLVDRIIILDNGKVIADGPKDAVLNALKGGNNKAGK